jgi:hypothetical protein
LVRCNGIAAHADDVCALALEARVRVAKLRRFVRSTGGVVFRIEP